jgi:hypothetical protein
VIAERQLERVTGRGRRRVTVRFMRPELEARVAGVWICPYEIDEDCFARASASTRYRP